MCCYLFLVLNAVLFDFGCRYRYAMVDNHSSYDIFSSHDLKLSPLCVSFILKSNSENGIEIH